MKKLIIALVIFALVAAASFCIYDAMFYNAWPELKELPRFKSKEIYSVDNFTDSIYYAKFTYRKVTDEDLKNAEYFEKITEENIDEVRVLVDEYESFINNIGGVDEIKNNYDFDKSVMSEGDYYYSETGDGFVQREDGYTSDFCFINLYYFDAETQVLYYFQNSI